MGTSASFPSESSFGKATVSRTRHSRDVINTNIKNDDSLQVRAGGEDQSGDTTDKEEKSQEKDEKEESIDNIHLKKEQALNILNRVIIRICQMSSLHDEDGSLREDLLNYFEFINALYYVLGNIKPSAYDVVKKFRREAGQRLSKTKVISLMCNIAIHIWNVLSRHEEEIIDMDEIGMLQKILNPLWSYSDCTHEVTYDIATENEFLETLIKILNRFRVKCQTEKEMTHDEGWLIQAVLSIFHNTSSVDSNVIRIRSTDINSVLESYLDSTNDEYRLAALATLANIINEKECAILEGKHEIVKFLLEMFGTALKSQNHRSSGLRAGWSAQECAATIRHLARNDANKKLLVEMGCLPHLVELAKSATVEEQREAVSAMWVLSFDTDNQKKIKEDKKLNVLELLNYHKNNEDMQIKEAVEGTLWNLEELQNRNNYEQKVKPKERWKKAVDVILKRNRKKDADTRDNVGDIMISYNWDHQKELVKILTLLKVRGYSVWMDIEQMSGSTVQAMAEAVESSHVVLVCMSQKYKDSSNCRAEAEYAFKKKKRIVPLNMERGYEPDGWLGIIIGTKLVFDFSGKYHFDNKFNDLVKELDFCFGKKVSSAKHERIIREVAEDTVDAIPVSITSRNVSHPNYTRSLASVRKWTQGDVEKWVVKYNLPREEFGHLKGRDLAALVAMRAEAPDCFYDCLLKNLKISSLNNLSTIDMFVEAIEGLWD